MKGFVLILIGFILPCGGGFLALFHLGDGEGGRPIAIADEIKFGTGCVAFVVGDLWMLVLLIQSLRKKPVGQRGFEVITPLPSPDERKEA